METRTFQARQMKEALALVRRELGPDAVIVETKRVSGRALGLLGGSFIQVTASPGEGGPISKPAPKAAPKRPAAKTSGEGQAAPNTASETPTPRRTGLFHALTPRKPDEQSLMAAARARRAQRSRPVREVIAEDPTRAMTTQMGRVLPHAPLRRRLLAAMVPRDLCEAWLGQLPDLGPSTSGRASEEAQLRSLLHRVLGEPAPLCTRGCRVAAFVGPTGVGKTTTIAKVAAKARLFEQKSVALISLDDKRIGSTTQLRAYAQLLNVPLATATSSGGLARALARVRDADLVLIDTAGISPGRRDEFSSLARQLERAGEPVTTHLCVAASTRIEELERILHLYRVTAPKAVVATKVDEAVAVGSVLAARIRSGAPLSFATTGQQVPEDLTIASPHFVLDLLLGGAQA